MRSLTTRLANLRPRPPAPPPEAQIRPPLQALSVPPLRPRVDIPICTPGHDAEAKTDARRRGQFLARQDAWDELAEEICAADKSRKLTPGLSPISALLAEGARADLVGAASMAAARGEPKTAWTVLSALEVNLEDTPDCPAMAAVMALAHIDLARSFRGASQPQDLAPQRRLAYEAHIAAAARLADRFDPFQHESPLWAKIRCQVLEYDPRPAQRVADDYEDLMDLDPHCPEHLISLGHDLLPRRYGTYEMLDVQARRAVGRLADIWGTGAYSWVYIGALQVDPGAYRRLDTELFAEGLHVILEKHPSQHMANWLAAFTGLSVASDATGQNATLRLSKCFAWILQDHMRELHPMVWAEAPVPGKPDHPKQPPAEMARLGRIRAISTIAEHFAPALEAGRRLVFTPNGVQLRKGD